MSAPGVIEDGKIGGLSPRDGTELEPVPVSSADEVLRAVAGAREAQRIWAEHSPRDRADRLKAVAATLLERAEHLVNLMAREQGKSRVESYTSEIRPATDLLSYWAAQAPKLLVPETTSLNPVEFPKKAGVVELRPRGVVALISSSSHPLAIPLRTLVPALAAGNAVLLKPSEYAPRVGAALAELFEGLGVPGLVAVVQGGPQVAEQLIAADVDHIVFTGSLTAGRKVAHSCAERFISYSLHLGGKDPALVLADADLERAVEGTVWGAFSNAGQSGASIERVYVVEAVAKRYIDRVIERVGQLTVADGTSENFDVGPLVKPAVLKTVERHVEDAVAAGATVRTGGRATEDGRVFLPTVLTDVEDEMAVMSEETFGPVMPIAVVRDEEEAIARANRSAYGLTASVWTRDIERGRKLAARLHTGVVTINNHGFTVALPHAPWHGHGQSGGGVANSRFGFYDLVEPHFVLIDRNEGKELWWFPHDANLTRLSRSVATLLGAPGGRIKALWTLARAALARRR